MMVKRLTFFLFSLLSIVGFAQDTLILHKTHCTLQLQQIRPHINNTYIALDYKSRLLLLDSSFNVKQYGPTIEYINLNDNQSPLQLIAISTDNTIIYLDQNLTINRTVSPPDNIFLTHVSPTATSLLWVNHNSNLVLFDPHFNTITKSIELPTNINSVLKTTYISETLYVFDDSTTFKTQANQNTLSPLKKQLTGIFSLKNQLFTYGKHFLNTNNKCFYIKEPIQFIQSNNRKTLLIDTKGGLHTCCNINP